jgi:hypothetical protein
MFSHNVRVVHVLIFHVAVDHEFISTQVHMLFQVFISLHVHAIDHEFISVHVQLVEPELVVLHELTVIVSVDHELSLELFHDRYLSAFSKVILSSPDAR